MRLHFFSPGKYPLIILLLPLLMAAKGNAQSLGSHSSLLGWEQEVKRFILDRAHNYGGTNFNRGLFREHITPMTPEHEIDLMTYQYTLMDDYTWEQEENGYKLYMGSLNAKVFATGNHLKSTIQINDHNSLKINGIQEEYVRADRFFVSLNYERDFKGDHAVGFSHTVSKAKGDLDASLYYKYGSFPKGMVKVETTFLDWASDVTESLAEDSENKYNDYDIIYKYTKQPELLSLQLVSPELSHFRAELLAGLQTPLKKTVIPEDTLKYNEREWTHYTGALLEYFNQYLTVGFTYQRTFSKLKRNPLPGSSYEPDYRNWQFTNRYGFYATADIFKGLRIEQWTWYEHNTDRLQGVQVPDELHPFDYFEKRVKLKSRLLYDNGEQGIKTGIEFHADYRYPQGEEMNDIKDRNFRELYPVVRERSERLTLTFGYRLNPGFYFLAGVSYDIDRDRESGGGYPRITGSSTWFDGGFGRLIVTW